MISEDEPSKEDARLLARAHNAQYDLPLLGWLAIGAALAILLISGLI